MSELTFAEQAYIALAKQFERDLSVERQTNAALRKDVESAQSQIAALEVTKRDLQTYKETHGGETFVRVQQENEELLEHNEELQAYLAESRASLAESRASLAESRASLAESQASLAESRTQIIRYEALSRPPERCHVSVATENVESDVSNQEERPHKRHRRSSPPSNISPKIRRPRRSPPTGWNQTQIVDLDDSDDDQDFNESDAQSIDDDDVIDVETLDRDLHVKPTVSNGRLFAGKCYMRKEIRSLLGGNLHVSKNVVRGRRLGVRNFASFPVMFHPRIPAVPGADGEVFLGLTYEATLGTKGGSEDIFEVFSGGKAGSSGPSFWKYLGTYCFTRLPPLTVDEWRGLPHKVQDSYSTLTKTRLHLKEDIDISAIKTRYLSGVYKCPRIKLTCVGFHRTLQERLGNLRESKC